MTATVTDLFCGAGGSSSGAAAAGATIVVAANHWQRAIDVHQINHPDARHDCADISQADPRRYPRTDILIASPECTNHSQARGVSRKSQDASLFDSADLGAERSRATMWDVVRFAEQMDYKAIVVENVVEAVKWILWPAWRTALESLGYELHLLSHNSMHHGVPQSRDRIYCVWLRKGIKADLELERKAHCDRCNTTRTVRQAWKQGRSVGRYRTQYVWSCIRCSRICEPHTEPAAKIIDWSLPTPRFGDKARAQATRDRIGAGLVKYGWAPILTTGAGNVFERTPGNRARPLTEPMATQSCTATQALATPPNFLMATTHSGRTSDLDKPHPTVAATDDRLSLIIPLRNHGYARPTTEPVQAVSANGNHHALLMRNNKGGSEMITPITEPARTMTSAGHQSLLTPTGIGQLVDECGFRMLEPFEIARAMSFADDYIPRDLPKKDQVKLAGNAVTPPVMQWIIARVIQALEAA